MSIIDAQRDIRRAYVGGGPGVLVSALVWLAAALVAPGQGTGRAFAVLFFGGMLIFPLAALLVRFVFRREREAPDNPLGMIALESTIAMLGGFLAAWLFLPVRPEFVFPLAAVAVGTHYFAFKSVYGDRLFWLLGALITAVGLAAIFARLPIPGGPVLTVAAIELVFAAWLTTKALRAGPAA